MAGKGRDEGKKLWCGGEGCEDSSRAHQRTFTFKSQPSVALRAPRSLLVGESKPSRNLAFITATGLTAQLRFINQVSVAGRTPQNPLRASLGFPLVKNKLRPEDGFFFKRRVLCLGRKSGSVREKLCWRLGLRLLRAGCPLLSHFVLHAQPLVCTGPWQSWWDVQQRQPPRLHSPCTVPFPQCSHLEFAPSPNPERTDSNPCLAGEKGGNWRIRSPLGIAP